MDVEREDAVLELAERARGAAELCRLIAAGEVDEPTRDALLLLAASLLDAAGRVC